MIVLGHGDVEDTEDYVEKDDHDNVRDYLVVVVVVATGCSKEDTEGERRE